MGLGRLSSVLGAATLLIAIAAAAPTIEAAIVTVPDVRIERTTISSLGRSAPARSARLPIRADMVGASWSGPSSGFELRVRRSGGAWSAWVEVQASGDGPDPGSVEARASRGRKLLATPLHVGAADEVQVRTHGAAMRDVRIEAVNTTGTATRASRVETSLRARAASLVGASVPTADAIALAPKIRTRSSWGASKPKSSAALADVTKGVVVHHTVSVNGYSCAAVPSMLRGIQRYHMRSNGWNDIGYNFIVDRCGGVWEARGGGIMQAVIGAHTAGFNTGTVGIALLGTHGSTRPTAAARLALQRLIAWRLDVAHVLPTGKMRLTARSGDKFRVGQQVSVRAVSGHRDLFPTSCPGAAQYKLLGADAIRARSIGGLKVANVTSTKSVDPATGVLRSAVVRAVSTDKAAMLRVAIERASTGEVLAQQANTGGVTRLDARALPAAVPAWDVYVRVTAATSTQRARGAYEPLVRYGYEPGFVVTTPPPASVQLDPAGTADSVVQVGYSLALHATVGAWLHDPVSGTRITTLETSSAAGDDPTSSALLDVVIPAGTNPGTYELRVGVAADLAPGRSVQRFPLTITR